MRSNVRPAKDTLFPNHLQLPALEDGDTTVLVDKPIVTPIQDYYNDPVNIPIFSTDELLGMTVLREHDTIPTKNGRELVEI